MTYMYHRLWGTLWVILNMAISKSAILLANEHQSDRKKCYKRFSYKFSLCIHAKNDSVIGMPDHVASRRILTKWQPKYFIEYKAI